MDTVDDYVRNLETNLAECHQFLWELVNMPRPLVGGVKLKAQEILAMHGRLPQEECTNGQ